MTAASGARWAGQADELRTAAKLMRERGQAATPGPWQHMCMGSDGCLVLRATGTVRERGRGRVAKFWLKDWHADHADAGYVASMHPGVALALADWLDAEASVIGMGGYRQPDPAALAVAHAYLGNDEGAQS